MGDQYLCKQSGFVWHCLQPTDSKYWFTLSCKLGLRHQKWKGILFDFHKLETLFFGGVGRGEDRQMTRCSVIWSVLQMWYSMWWGADIGHTLIEIHTSLLRCDRPKLDSSGNLGSERENQAPAWACWTPRAGLPNELTLETFGLGWTLTFISCC